MFFDPVLGNPGPNGTDTFASVFGGSSTYGQWYLATADDSAGQTGSLGSWSLTLTTTETSTGILGTDASELLIITSSSATSGSMTFNGATTDFTGLETILFVPYGGQDTVIGGDGIERILDQGLPDGDNFNGGGGLSDSIEYVVDYNIAIVTSLTFDLTAGLVIVTSGPSTNANDTIAGFENLVAGITTDLIYGTSTGNNLDAGSGNDSVYGGEGADTLLGSWGDDVLTGGEGQDSVYGGLDNDFIAIDALSDHVMGETYDGGDGADTIRFDNGGAAFSMI